MSALWIAEDGSLVLVIANFSEEAASFPVDLTLSDYTSDGSVYKKTYDLRNTTESDVKIKDQRIIETVDLGPLEIKIIEMLK